jgi:DNA-binding response OmpR family regulator
VAANAASVASKLMASILVVDEDREQCHSMVRSLRAQGYAASSAATFSDAIAAARESHYDVLLTDQRIQGGDGMDLILALREASPGTRPVLMSANATARESQRALDLGAVRVLSKPFEVDEMLQAVERAAEYAGGFWASVHGISLIDTLQMFHYSRRSLSVRFLGSVGATLHMREGQLLHAEHGELRGEDALAAILRMPAGSLQTFALEPVPQTIFKDFQAVLLDQLRQLDERERDSKLPEHADALDADFSELDDEPCEDDTGLRRAPTAESLGRPSATSGARRAVRGQEAKKATLEKVDIACERIVNAVDGALACALIELATGAVLGIHNSLGFSVEQSEAVAAATVDLFRGASSSRIESIVRLQASGERSADHAFEEVQLTSKYNQHFAKTLGSGRAVILLVTSRSTSLGMGWAQVRAAIPILERLLLAAAR